MLELIVVLLVVFWLFGLLADLGGGLVHILLVIALVVLIFRLLQGRKVL